MNEGGILSGPIQRHSVTDQVAAHLKQEIARGRWPRWLPTERSLAVALRVSRSTLRIALRALQREGAIEPLRARGHRVLRQQKSRSAAITRSIGLLVPGPLPLHAPFAHTWLDHLRAELHDHGIGIVLHENAHVFLQHRRATLELLVERNPHDAWVLVLSTPGMQAWFVRSGIPCVLAGSPQRGIELPSVDVDFFAACRHAALRLLQLGHRRILFVNERSPARGYHISETGFRDGIASYPQAKVELIVRRVRPDERLLPAQLHPIWRRRDPPTAVVVMTAGRCLGVAGCLAQLGLRVPRDVSLVCRSAGSFFEHMVPAPAHYDFRPDEYAALLARHVLAQAGGSARGVERHQLMPRFVAGESLAPPAKQRAETRG